MIKGISSGLIVGREVGAPPPPSDSMFPPPPSSPIRPSIHSPFSCGENDQGYFIRLDCWQGSGSTSTTL